MKPRPDRPLELRNGGLGEIPEPETKAKIARLLIGIAFLHKIRASHGLLTSCPAEK